MAGLIVIDFIDMEQNSHVRKVEKAMKEALKNDRARIQVGRISSFGLMEMSRQRLRTGVLEASTKPCPHCEGTGLMRTAASAGLSALRILEDEAARGRGERICLRAGKEAAVYVLNKKRAELADIEQRYGVMIEVLIDESFEGARMTVDSSGPRPVAAPRPQAPVIEEDDDVRRRRARSGRRRRGRGRRRRSRGRARPKRKASARAARRRRRRRGGRGRSRREGGERSKPASRRERSACARGSRSSQVAEEPERAAAEEPREGGTPAPRRRGRGGAAAKRRRPAVEPDSSPMVERPIDEEPPIAETEPSPSRSLQRRSAAGARRPLPTPKPELAVAEPAPAEAPPAETAEQAAPAEKPARKRRSKKADGGAEAGSRPAAEPIPVPAANNDTADEADGEPRRGLVAAHLRLSVALFIAAFSADKW